MPQITDITCVAQETTVNTIRAFIRTRSSLKTQDKNKAQLSLRTQGMKVVTDMRAFLDAMIASEEHFQKRKIAISYL